MRSARGYAVYKIGSVWLVAKYAAGQSWWQVIAASLVALALVWTLDKLEV